MFSFMLIESEHLKKLHFTKPVDKPIDDLFGFVDAEPFELTSSRAPSSSDVIITINHYLDEPRIARTEQNINAFEESSL